METSADEGTMVQSEAPARSSGAAMPSRTRNPLRWFVFAVAITANIMDLMDATIVNVAARRSGTHSVAVPPACSGCLPATRLRSRCG